MKECVSNARTKVMVSHTRQQNHAPTRALRWYCTTDRGSVGSWIAHAAGARGCRCVPLCTFLWISAFLGHPSHPPK